MSVFDVLKTLPSVRDQDYVDREIRHIPGHVLGLLFDGICASVADYIIATAFVWTNLFGIISYALEALTIWAVAHNDVRLRDILYLVSSMPAHRSGRLYAHLVLFYTSRSLQRVSAVVLGLVTSREAVGGYLVAIIDEAIYLTARFAVLAVLYRDVTEMSIIAYSFGVACVFMLTITSLPMILPRWVRYKTSILSSRPMLRTVHDYGYAILMAVLLVGGRCFAISQDLIATTLQRRNVQQSEYQHLEQLEYSRLEDKEIRLLVVTRDAPFGSYKCRLATVTLGTKLTYEAISYTWGDLPRKQKLRVSGRFIFVSQRVIDVVESQASFFDEKMIWIDSVCINQADAEERGVQVPLMREIYSSAETVRIWLGDPVDQGDACFCFNYIVQTILKFSESLSDVEYKNILNIGSDDRGWMAFFALLQHPYWSRVWIVQEIVSAKRAIISYGGLALNWSSIELLYANMVKRPLGTLFIASQQKVLPKYLPPAGALQIQRILIIKARMLTPGVRLGLEELLAYTRTFQATDPHDYVFALLGLTTTENPYVQVDYQTDMASVCTNIARQYYQSDNLLAMSIAGIGRHTATHNLPSWVGDYADRVTFSPLTGGNADRSLLYCASGSRGLTHKLHPEQSAITLKFIPFDTIDSLGAGGCSRPSDTNQFMRYATVVTQTFIEIERFIQHHYDAERHGGKLLSEITWRLTIGDRNLTSSPGIPRARPAPEIFGHFYSTFMKAAHEALAHQPDSDTSTDNFERDDQSKSVMLAANNIFRAHAFISSGRRLAVTAGGVLGWVPELAQKGDVIGVLDSAQALYVFRAMDKPGGTNNVTLEDDGASVEAKWRLVGEGYLYGCMDGELLRLGREWQTIGVW